jgi:multisubunit Na+/H+ antiporter MnhE subunit
MGIDIMEYIIGFIVIVGILIYYIGMVVWQDTITRRFQKIIKTAEINNKEIHESDLSILKQTLFPNGSDIKIYIILFQQVEFRK